MTEPIEPKNLSAQLGYQARGNPPGAHPQSAVGNFFPGLEFNFLSIWKRIFIGIELLESQGIVINVDDTASAEIQALRGQYLIAVDGRRVFTRVTGPGVPPGNNAPLVWLEWGNFLADVHHQFAGSQEPVNCTFFNASTGTQSTVPLHVRRLMQEDTVVIASDAVKPGELTESLCSPWQTDFIGCACYYWAANRPDYINLWDNTDGSHGGGHNWLNESREMRPIPGSTEQRPFYTLEPGQTLEHEDIMQDWEKKLRFVIGGQDET